MEEIYTLARKQDELAKAYTNNTDPPLVIEVPPLEDKSEIIAKMKSKGIDITKIDRARVKNLREMGINIDVKNLASPFSQLMAVPVYDQKKSNWWTSSQIENIEEYYTVKRFTKEIE